VSGRGWNAARCVLVLCLDTICPCWSCDSIHDIWTVSGEHCIIKLREDGLDQSCCLILCPGPLQCTDSIGVSPREVLASWKIKQAYQRWQSNPVPDMIFRSPSQPISSPPRSQASFPPRWAAIPILYSQGALRQSWTPVSRLIPGVHVPSLFGRVLETRYSRAARTADQKEDIGRDTTCM